MPNNTGNNYEGINTEQISLLNKRIDSLNTNVFELKNQFKVQTELNSKTILDIAWWNQIIRSTTRDMFMAAGGYVGSPAGKNPVGSVIGAASYDILQKWIDSLIISNKPTSNQPNNKSDYSMISYYDEDNKKIKFDRLQHLNGPTSEFGIDSAFKSIGERLKKSIDLFNQSLNLPIKNIQPKTQKLRRVKVRKPPKPKTSADEDFGDNTLNKVYNTTKKALELGNVNFDKSKLLVESINFENAYLKAFNKEVDYKKEISTLQEELNKLQGDDLETMNKQLTLQSQISQLKKDEVSSLLTDEFNKIENLQLKGSLLQVNELMDALEKIEKRLTLGGLDIESENTLLKSKKGIENQLGILTERKGINTIPDILKPDEKNRSKTKKKEDPVDTFVGVFTEAQKIGGALTTIMQTLNIGADTFVGGIINGFNSALSIIQTMITVMQAVNTIKMFLPFATGGNVPGIGDTDSVPAMLTPGEYVVKKSVVKKFGSGFFEWINGGGLTNSLAGHYAGGGMVAAVGRQMVAVSIPDVKIKGSDLYLSWRRQDAVNTRRAG